MQEHIVVPIPIPHGNFISLTLPSLAKFLPSPTPHPPGYSHFPPHSLTGSHVTPYLHLPTSTKKFHLHLMCMVLNKSAKLQTDKCNNILPKIENFKSRTCRQMHCEETANCQLSRQKAVCSVPPWFVPRSARDSSYHCRGIFGN